LAVKFPVVIVNDSKNRYYYKEKLEEAKSVKTINESYKNYLLINGLAFVSYPEYIDEISSEISNIEIFIVYSINIKRSFKGH
jgi:hypothetical protein